MSGVLPLPTAAALASLPRLGASVLLDARVEKLRDGREALVAGGHVLGISGSSGLLEKTKRHLQGEKSQ